MCNALAIEGAEHGILANAILPVAYTRLAGAPDITDTSDQAVVARAEAASARARMLPEWVSPMVVYLASEECTRTRHYYSAALGRFARVFIAATSGWYAPGDTPPTVEAIEAHLDVIENRDEFDLPDSVFDEDRQDHRAATRRNHQPASAAGPIQRLLTQVACGGRQTWMPDADPSAMTRYMASGPRSITARPRRSGQVRSPYSARHDQSRRLR